MVIKISISIKEKVIIEKMMNVEAEKRL